MAFSEQGVTGRAVKSGKVTLQLVNPREFAINDYGTVDDRPYGGGPGMVMRVEPMVSSIRHLQQLATQQLALSKPVHRVLLSPQGQPLTQQVLARLAQLPALILVAGRYEGIDERVTELAIDEEISVGDYVVSGGELPAMLVMDGITRLLENVLGHQDSAKQDSFVEAGLLDHPHYSRPVSFEGLTVPPVLLSGNHQAITDWRAEQALLRTKQRRPDLLPKR